MHKNTKKNSKSIKNPNKTLVMFSANADGLNKKVHSLQYQIKECNATVTNFRKKGRFKYEEFEIFEATRQNKEKGGCMIGIHKSLEPVLIGEYFEKFELIVTEVKISNKEIRIITGYVALEEEIVEDESLMM